MERKIALIGSTGSIGRQTLEVIRANKQFKVVSLSAYSNKQLLYEQITEFKPKVACIAGMQAPSEKIDQTEVYFGEDNLLRTVLQEADLIFVAVTGFAGLKVVLKAIEMGKNIALANKETLVCGGSLVMQLAREKGVEIIPVDSEHSALWQSLGCKKEGYSKLILTASGGPFRCAKMCEMRHFKANDALNHPNWSMGKKITVDCATMLNKGFEVIEAHYLFGAPLDKIEVIVHPQSIVHSMVEFADGSIIAEMSTPDMKQPIQFALTYPEKLATGIKPLNFAELGKLEFYPLEEEKFPCFTLAVESLKQGGNMPCAMNAASEVAVNAFLQDKIAFTDIAEVIRYVMKNTKLLPVTVQSLESTDAQARELAKIYIEEINLGN